MKEAIKSNIQKLHRYLAKDKRLQLVFAAVIAILDFKTVQALDGFWDFQLFFSFLGVLLILFVLDSE